MNNLELRCAGNASIKHRAERARVCIDIEAREESQETAMNLVAETANSIKNDLNFNSHYKESVESLHLQRLSTYSREQSKSITCETEKTWYHASTEINFTINDFDAMSKALSHFAKRKLVRIAQITYSLREETRARLEAEVRKKAVSNAIDTAKEYFRACTVEEFELVKLSDISTKNPWSWTWRNNNYRPGRSSLFGASANTDDERKTQNLNFEPGALELSFEVSMHFQAGAPKFTSS